jgi:hypothetical protein
MPLAFDASLAGENVLKRAAQVPESDGLASITGKRQRDQSRASEGIASSSSDVARRKSKDG